MQKKRYCGLKKCFVRNKTSFPVFLHIHIHILALLLSCRGYLYGLGSAVSSSASQPNSMASFNSAAGNDDSFTTYLSANSANGKAINSTHRVPCLLHRQSHSCYDSAGLRRIGSPAYYINYPSNTIIAVSIVTRAATSSSSNGAWLKDRQIMFYSLPDLMGPCQLFPFSSCPVQKTLPQIAMRLVQVDELQVM